MVASMRKTDANLSCTTTKLLVQYGQIQHNLPLVTGVLNGQF